MEKKLKILIIEDDEALNDTMRDILVKRDYQVSQARSYRSALPILKEKKFDLILLDLTLPDGDGLDILKNFSEDYKNRFIIISGTGTIEKAVEAMKQGAFDFLEKTVDRDVILATMEKAIELNRQLDDYRDLINEFKSDSSFKQIIFKSTTMRKLLKRAYQLALGNDYILITGETGTGKELFAHAIHNASKRNNGPFIPVNCATISKELAESELFGFEKGAFTDAHKPYPGKFGLAEYGTIFLDEIAELSEPVQAKLLRVLEDGEIFPLRSNKAKTINVRVISATNKDLELLIKVGNFRKDLFFRVDQNKIHIPPLKDRVEDIIPLARHFLRISAISNSQPPKIIRKATEGLLKNYPWPGNVRELKNTINSLAPFITSKEIKPEHLPLKISKYKESSQLMNHLPSLSDSEREHILTVLHSTEFNMQKSAKILSVSRTTLYRKLSKYNIGHF